MTGNLHFESVMLFFLIAGLYNLQQQKILKSAVLIACSVSIKLVPLLLLPLFYKWFINKDKNQLLGLLKLSGFYIVIIILNLLFFAPFYASEFITNYSNSVGLWFKNFEFNASFYYIFREIGYWFRGYNEIAIIGKTTPILTILFLLYFTFFRKNTTLKQIITSMLFCICFYYFTSSTVHPWYIATPLILSLFTRFKFPVVWSFVIILSYQAYANTPWQENLWIIAAEYVILFSFLMYELQTKNNNLIKN